MILHRFIQPYTLICNYPCTVPDTMFCDLSPVKFPISFWVEFFDYYYLDGIKADKSEELAVLSNVSAFFCHDWPLFIKKERKENYFKQ